MTEKSLKITVKLPDKKLFLASNLVQHVQSIPALNGNESDEDLQKDSANSSAHSNHSEMVGSREGETDADSRKLVDSNLVESLSANSTSSSEESSGSADEEDSQSDEDERPANNMYQTSHHHRTSSIGRKFVIHDKEDLFLHSLEVDHFAPSKFLGKSKFSFLCSSIRLIPCVFHFSQFATETKRI